MIKRTVDVQTTTGLINVTVTLRMWSDSCPGRSSLGKYTALKTKSKLFNTKQNPVARAKYHVFLSASTGFSKIFDQISIQNTDNFIYQRSFFIQKSVYIWAGRQGPLLKAGDGRRAFPFVSCPPCPAIFSMNTFSHLFSR